MIHWLPTLTIVNRALAVTVSLAPAAIWQWMTARGQSRGNTFFGARVAPGFAESEAGRAISSKFRKDLWSRSTIAAAISLSIPVGLAALVGSMLGSLSGAVAFGLAHRRTRRDSHPAAAPTMRVASLTSEDQKESAWLESLDWLAMLLPPMIPVATLAILALHWSQLPEKERHTLGMLSVFFALILGLMCAANQWALRFRSRSSDWAPTPGASHKYRTYLGAMQALIFAFPSCQICALTLMASHAGWLGRVDIFRYFEIALPLEALWLMGVWRMRFWLSKHTSIESSDPMSDTCWIWGLLYFNRSDPALVVPLRAGVGQSYNCARPGVWVVCAAVMVLTIASLVQSVGALAR